MDDYPPANNQKRIGASVSPALVWVGRPAVWE